MAKFTQKVAVLIEAKDFVDLLIRALYPKAQAAQGKERVFFMAFASLVGCTDVEAVKIANREAGNKSLPRIKVDEFRRWLPQMLSETFGEFIAGEDDEDVSGIP